MRHKCFDLESLNVPDDVKIDIAFANLKQTRLQGEVWFENAKKNFVIADRWVNELTIDTPAVVMAAGASLFCRYRDVFADYKKFTTVAVDRSNDYLLYLGIVPEYLVCKDALPVVSSFIERVDQRTKVLVSLQCDISVAEKAKERGCEVYFFGPVNPTSSVAKAMYREFGEQVGLVMEGSVVTFDACDFAIQAGSKEIVLVGNDLRYYSKHDATLAAKTQGDLRNFGDNSYSTKIFHEASGCFNSLPKIYDDVKFVSYSTVPTMNNTEVKMFLNGWENR